MALTIEQKKYIDKEYLKNTLGSEPLKKEYFDYFVENYEVEEETEEIDFNSKTDALVETFPALQASLYVKDEIETEELDEIVEKSNQATE